MTSDAILCPECGWSGERIELETVEGDHQCPVCAEVVEFVD
jgi:predicted RNA-binding Zn-ribbon protein involved in translation (DUF1610 family)